MLDLKKAGNLEETINSTYGISLAQAFRAENGWCLPKNGGGALIGGRWYTEHVLERMAPRTPEVMAELESRALEKAKARGLEPRTNEFNDWWLANGPDPRGVPPLVIEAGIANPGSTNIQIFLSF